jgi:hypothetical protein
LEPMANDYTNRGLFFYFWWESMGHLGNERSNRTRSRKKARRPKTIGSGLSRIVDSTLPAPMSGESEGLREGALGATLPIATDRPLNLS